MSDVKLGKFLLLLLLLPIAMATCSGDRFRYPCQDPNNWDDKMCQKPYCDVTRTCPEHVFKGQIDPRTLGKGKNELPTTTPQAPTWGQPNTNTNTGGCNCGK